MYVRPGETSTGRMCPGTRVANATMPGPPCAVYSVMKSDPPPATRLIIPKMPPPPPRPVVVCMSMDWLIQDNSPDTASTLSPGWSCISSTGSVVPMIRWFIGLTK